MNYFLHSARLGFRSWTEADLPLAEALWADPHVTRFIGGPFSPEMVRSRLQAEIENKRRFGVQYWPVFLLDGDAHLGCAGLRPCRLEPRIYELGSHLRPAFWGQGFAQEAARAAIDYAFSKLGAEALFAGHHPANEASRRLLLKLGFLPAGQELYPPTGLLHPSYLLHKITA
jgi:[ribosomal protein S5]-alanine N-acetyltransferase